jgi:hypothetical protein
MATTYVFEMPGVTQKQYDQVMRDLEGAGAASPDGRSYHVSMALPQGWMVIDVWDSDDKFGRFAQTLVPILQRNGIVPPQPRTLPVHNIVTA